MDNLEINNINIFDIDLPIVLNKMSKNFNRDYGEFLKPYGLSKIHSLYLLCLHKRKDGMKLKELNEVIGCDKANTSRAISDLQEKGIICRNTENENEKKYLVKLTEHGYNVSTKFAELVKQNVNKVISKLTKEEMSTLIGIFKKLEMY